jgi:thioredoxin reductase
MMNAEVVIMTRTTSGTTFRVAPDTGPITLDTLPERFDVAVIGGGAAGLSAALILARSRRAVVVIDAGAPRNAPAAGVHGFLTREGTSPIELLALGRAEVEQYGGQIVQGEATSARRTSSGFESGFEVDLKDGRIITARRLVVTTGLVDELPNIAGLRERWGRDVLHCPYCHGWEFRDQPIGVLATSAAAIHQALLFRQLTSDIVVFTHLAPDLTVEHAEQLAAAGIRAVPGVVEALEVEDDHLTGVRLRDGTTVARRALVVAPRFVARSEVLTSLGLAPSPTPMAGEYIAADANGQTAIPGVWVAGNATDLKAQVVVAAAGGVTVGTQVNADLVKEDTDRVVRAHRQRNGAAFARQIASAS